jgi:hypothetical protein
MSSRHSHREHREGDRSRHQASSSHPTDPEKPRKSRNPFRKRRPQTDSQSRSHSHDGLVKAVRNFRVINTLVEKSHKEIQQTARTLMELYNEYKVNGGGTQIRKEIKKLNLKVAGVESFHCDVRKALAKEERSLDIAPQPEDLTDFQEELTKDILASLVETNTTIRANLKKYQKSEITKHQHESDAYSEFIHHLQSLANGMEVLTGQFSGGPHSVIGTEFRTFPPGSMKREHIPITH